MARTTQSRTDSLRERILRGEVSISGGSDDAVPTLRERLAELHDLLGSEETRRRFSDAELGAARDELRAMHVSIRAGEAEVQATDLAVMGDIANCLAALYAEAGGRFTLAAATADEIAALEAITLADDAAEEVAEPEAEEVEPEAEAEAEPEAEAAAEVEPEVPAAAPEAPAPEAAREPVRVPRISELRARDPRPDVPATIGVSAQGQTLVQLMDGRRVTVPEYFEHIARNAHSTLGRANEHIVQGRIPLLPAGAPVLDSRRDSPETLQRKLQDAVGIAMSPRGWNPDGSPSDELLASGGWGTPAPVVYDLQQISVADRPVLNGLPSVGSDRGGLTFVRPPKFSDVTQGGPATTTAATGVWTSDTDTTPGSTVKSHQVVPTGTPVTEQLDAIFMQLQEGVLMARAYPEWISTWGQNTNAAWAQEAERHLLDKVSASAITKHITVSTLSLGATRELLRAAILLASGERNRQRMAPETMVRAMFPTWVIDLVAADLVISGTNFVDSTPMVVARNYFTQQLRAANINASFYIDERTGAGQLFAAQSDAASLTGFRTHCEWFMWHEGAFVVGNGGELNLGIVRDSTLVNTNDFRLFSESFETIFDRGIWAYRVRQEVCPNGVAAGLLASEISCSIS